jgi:hypothetical protein
MRYACRRGEAASACGVRAMGSIAHRVRGLQRFTRISATSKESASMVRREFSARMNRGERF